MSTQLARVRGRLLIVQLIFVLFDWVLIGLQTSQLLAQRSYFVGNLPCVVVLAECLSVSYETSTVLVQVSAAFGASQTRGVPLEVGRYFQDELVRDGLTATDAT